MKYWMIKKSMIAISLAWLSSVTYAATAPLSSHYPSQTYSWTGYYAGINVGEIFNHATIDSHQLGFVTPDGTCDNSNHFSSFFPGVQFGYAYQFESKMVLSLEGDFTVNNKQRAHMSCPCDPDTRFSDDFIIKNKRQGSLRGRMGYAFDHHLLPFVSVGGSLAALGLNYRNEGGDHYSDHTTHGGWLVGAGLEWGFSSDWSLRAEYYYTDYTSHALGMKIPTIYGLSDPNGKAHARLHTNNIRLALNYWF